MINIKQKYNDGIVDILAKAKKKAKFITAFHSNYKG